jgi:hypothetical protein
MLDRIATLRTAVNQPVGKAKTGEERIASLLAC